jgi:hypothetical protein
MEGDGPGARLVEPSTYIISGGVKGVRRQSNSSYILIMEMAHN